MASTFLANRVRVATATSGAGTVTLGAKTSNKYATFAEGGITDAQVVTYTIEDGNDWEIGRGTYTSSGTTLSRDTVLISSVAGTVGTSKLNLSGAAEVFITAAKEDLDVNDFTDIGAAATGDKLWVHDVSGAIKGSLLLSAIQTLFLAAQSDQETATSTTLFVAPGRQHFHPAHFKAGASFNGAGTPAVVRGWNVSSITDNNTGDYTLNWSITLSAATISTVTGCAPAGNVSTPVVRPETQNSAGSIAAAAATTTALRVTSGDGGATFRDHTLINAWIHGDI